MPPKPDRYYRECRICNNWVYGQIRLHLEREHLPWFMSMKKCFSCRKRVDHQRDFNLLHDRLMSRLATMFGKD